jgi:tetratricopeptide (TPR) repeat protein
MASYALTSAYRAKGDLDQARQMGETALKLVKQINGPWFEAYCRNELASVLRALGDYEGAKRHYEISYHIREMFRDPEGIAVARGSLGEIALLGGDYHEAHRLFEQNLDTYEEIGDRGGLARTLSGLGQAARALGDFTGACDHLRHALALSAEIQFVPLTLSIMGIIGGMLLAEGHANLAVKTLRCVVHHPSSDRETKEHAARILAGHGVTPGSPGSVELKQHVDSLLQELSLLRTR